MSDTRISYFAETNARAPRQRFGIKQADRLFHIYIIGKTGTGKSSLLETLALDDVRAKRGCALIDPHGDLAARVARQIPKDRSSDLIFIDAADATQPYGYNPLRGVRTDMIPLAASGLMEALNKMWAEAWGVRMEHVLRNTLYALLEQGGATLADVLKMLSDPAFRGGVLQHVKNEQVRAFWTHEFPHYNPRYRQEIIAPIQNKVGAFLADPRLYRMLTEPQIDVHFRKLMDDGGVLIVNLAKGRLGEDSSNLLGALLVTTLSLAAFTRVDVSEAKRRLFFIYIDEFQDFTTLSVANMISEIRKYGVGLILAHQHLHQLELEVRHAVLGNAGTLIAFRLGPEDAGIISREFEPIFAPADLTNLANHDVYLKLMIDGTPSRPFSATTLPSTVL